MTLHNLHRVLLLVVITFPLTGCLFRSHKVQPREVSKAPLKTATQAELIEYVNTQAARVQSMQATVDIDTSVGGVKKGKVTDYKQIRGYVLARKPAMLRMIGLLPIVRNRAFDMVSDGQVFKLWIPPKNRFIIGRNDIETHNIQQPLENLRPQQIYDALLLPHRQLIYNPAGDLVSDIHYESYKDFSGVNFPSIIEIWRPQEEYDITLTIVKLQLNEPLPNDKFTLEQPPGAQVVRLDQPPTKTPPGGDGR